MKIIPVCVSLALFISCKQQRDKSGTSDISSRVEKALGEFANRKRYLSLNQDTVKNIPDSLLEQALIDYVETKVSDNYDREHEIISGLAPGYMVVYSTWILEAEVNNGGFNQFFWNNSKLYAEDAKSGFKKIGDTAISKIVEEAIVISKRDEGKVDALKEKGTWEAFSDSYEITGFDKLDSQFIENSEKVSSLRRKFIRSHPEMFSWN